MAKLSNKHHMPRGLSKILDYDHLAALVLAKIAAWFKSARKQELGVTKTEEEWCLDLEVTPKQFRRVKTKLVKLGLIESTRGAWGKRPNAVFYKPTYLATRLLQNSIYWIPPRPNGQPSVPVTSPNGQLDYSSITPNGHFAKALKSPIGILPYTKETSNKGNFFSNANLIQFSALSTEELYQKVDEVSKKKVKAYEVESIPEVVAIWERGYYENFDDEYAPVWIPRHINLIEALIEDCTEETISNLKKCLAEEIKEASEANAEPDILENDEANQTIEVQGPICARETCNTIGRTIYWLFHSWDIFLECAKETPSLSNCPEKPEIEWLFYNLEILFDSGFEFEDLNGSDSYFDELLLFRKRKSLKEREEEFWKLAKALYPDTQVREWTLEDLKRFLGNQPFKFSFPFEALKLWDQWQLSMDDDVPAVPFSFDEMMISFDQLSDWMFAHLYGPPKSEAEKIENIEKMLCSDGVVKQESIENTI